MIVKRKIFEIEAEQFLGEPIFGITDIRVNPFSESEKGIDDRTLFLPYLPDQKKSASFGDWVIKKDYNDFEVLSEEKFKELYEEVIK